MSRRRGEFEHRTSIFEGAFRAWSHLGGLDPVDLEIKPASDLDPLTNPIEDDIRLTIAKKNGEITMSAVNPDGSHRREYPYEPLPRSGLAHPYVQAILSPWLGPDADNEAIQLGLTTLRTWWQHRRKGESGSAVAALGTEKMKGVVEGYTRHFFTLAHCLVINDKEQPPRTLHSRMKELEKMRKKGIKKRNRDDQPNASIVSSVMLSGSLDPSLAQSLQADLTDDTLSPLERLHAAQRRQLAEAGGLGSSAATQPIINLKGKCIPGKIDLPEVVDAVQRAASTQLAHRGSMPPPVTSSSSGIVTSSQQQQSSQFGDPNTTPVVFVSGTGDIQIAMTVDGITCAHCVKIVETVLRGCNGNKSPIDGLLDAAADRALNSVLLKIDRASNAKRIAFEAARNLSMVGYTARAKEMSIVGAGADHKATMDLGSLSTAFEVIANTDPRDVFDWDAPCTCPDNGVLREDCSRHSQMNVRIFEAFDAREQQVKEYMAGCGMRVGLPCSCGPDCRCVNCPIHNNGGGNLEPESVVMPTPRDPFNDSPINIDQNMDFTFGMGPPQIPVAPVPLATVNFASRERDRESTNIHTNGFPSSIQIEGNPSSRTSFRNPSVLSYGNGLRNMSLTSDATFGRAMSGLSALSIDWENLDDFDVDVDHSAHINNQGPSSPRRRSSLRRSFMSTGEKDSNAHVSFKVG